MAENCVSCSRQSCSAVTGQKSELSAVTQAGRQARAGGRSAEQRVGMGLACLKCTVPVEELLLLEDCRRCGRERPAEGTGQRCGKKAFGLRFPVQRASGRLQADQTKVAHLLTKGWSLPAGAGVELSVLSSSEHRAASQNCRSPFLLQQPSSALYCESL